MCTQNSVGTGTGGNYNLFIVRIRYITGCIYFVDTCFPTTINLDLTTLIGIHHIENKIRIRVESDFFVFMESRRNGLAIEYCRTGNGLEVDFIATDHRDAQTLYQASLGLRDEQTRKREVRALTTAMQ